MGMGVADTAARTKNGLSGEAPPPLSPSTSFVALGLVLGGVGLLALAILGTVYALWSLSTADSPAPTTVVAGAPATTKKPLSERLVDVPPTGYRLAPVGDGPNGPLDLEGAVRFAENPTEDRMVLERNGFESGFARTWVDGRGTGGRITASVLEFSTEAGADAIEEYESLRTIQRHSGTPIVVPGARALHFTRQSGGSTVYGYAVTIREGENRLYHLTAVYPTDAPPAEIVELTRQQQLRLQANR
jgi:hypothetical protein